MDGVFSGRAGRHDGRRICAHPIARRLRPFFRAYPVSDAAVTALSQELYDSTARTVLRTLAGWPAHAAATEEVKVNVIDALAGLRPFV